MAIIKWNEQRLKFAQNGEHSVALLPGYTQVSDEAWLAVRPHLTSDVESGRVEEANFEYVAPAAKGKQGELKDLVELKDMEHTKATKIIAGTYHIPTLEAWKEADGRNDVRAAILKKIEEVESHGSK